MENRTNTLNLPYIVPGQAKKHITHNESLEIIDSVVQLTLESLDISTPPAAPEAGQTWFVPFPAGGAWEEHSHEVAIWTSGAWQFLKPQDGWRAWVKDRSNILIWHEEAWQLLRFTSQNLLHLGLNAIADDTNRLSLNSKSSLFNHEGAGHQLKVNKADRSETGSVLFQTGFSGRAEMGLVGDDNFSLKTSADGQNWHEALVINGQNGVVSLPRTKTPLSVIMDNENKLHPAVKLSGVSRENSEDSAEGVGLYLTHNNANNRQLVLADTASLKGVRFLENRIEGYNDGQRTDLQIGSNTHGAHIGNPISNTQFSVSNQNGNTAKVVHSIVGHDEQAEDLLQISSTANGDQGDILKVRADKVSEFGGPIKLAPYTRNALPSVSESGALIFITDERGGPVPAYSDGSQWRRVHDDKITDAIVFSNHPQSQNNSWFQLCYWETSGNYNTTTAIFDVSHRYSLTFQTLKLRFEKRTQGFASCELRVEGDPLKNGEDYLLVATNENSRVTLYHRRQTSHYAERYMTLRHMWKLNEFTSFQYVKFNVGESEPIGDISSRS